MDDDDFFVDDDCTVMPFVYPTEMQRDLAPELDNTHPSVAGGPLLAAFLDTLPREGDTVQLLVALNAAVASVTDGPVRSTLTKNSGEEYWLTMPPPSVALATKS